MMMSRQQIHFPTLDAYHRGIALLAGVPVYVRNEKRRSVAAELVSEPLRRQLAELGATLREDARFDADRLVGAAPRGRLPGLKR